MAKGTKNNMNAPITKTILQLSWLLVAIVEAKIAIKGIENVPIPKIIDWYLPRFSEGSISEIYAIATVQAAIVPKPVQKRLISKSTK